MEAEALKRIMEVESPDAKETGARRLQLGKVGRHVIRLERLLKFNE